MQNQLKFSLLLSFFLGLLITNLSFANSYQLPLASDNNSLKAVNTALKQDSLRSELINNKKISNQKIANTTYANWQAEANNSAAIQAYEQELAERRLIKSHLNQLKDLVSFEFAQNKTEIVNQLHVSLINQQENFHLPVFIFSSASSTFQNEHELNDLLVNETALVITKKYGLERVFNQLTSKNSQLVEAVTQLNTSGKIQLNNQVASCVERNSTLHTSQIYKLSEYNFYPFANLNKYGKTPVSDTDKTKEFSLEVSLWPEETTDLPEKPVFPTCSDEFYNLIQQNDLAVKSKANFQRLTEVINEVGIRSQELASLVDKLFASRYGQGCSNLSCIEQEVNKPLPYPEVWPREVVFKSTTAANSLDASLFVLLGLELSNFISEQANLVVSEIAEEASLTSFSTQTNKEQLTAGIAAVKLLPYTGKGKEVGLVAKVTLVKPKAGLPEKTIKLGPHQITFRQINTQGSSLWVMETNLTKQVFNYFLRENKEYTNQILDANCTQHSQYASCISDYGLEWLAHWFSEKSGAQLNYPSCELWKGFLSQQDSSSCENKPGQLQGLCAGVTDACQAPGNRFFSLGWCDTCGKPQISDQTEIYQPSPKNGVRLILNN